MKKRTKNPLISVIMPVYNAGNFVSEAIDSILSQTYKNLEFIIVDDASTDDSWEIISDYKKLYPNKIKAIRLKKNLNMGGDAAGNIAYKYAKGEFIARMDADDITLPTRLEKQVNYMFKHPECSVLGSNAYVIDKEAVLIGEKKVPLTHKEIYKNYFILHPIIHPTVMIRKSALDEAKIFYLTDNPTNNDYLTFFAMISRGKKFANLKEKLIYYRIHGKNDSLARVKKTFINSLRSRFLAVFKFGYRPTFSALLTLIVQSFIALVLPERVVFNLYLIVSGIIKPSVFIQLPTFSIFARLRKPFVPNEALS